MIDVKDALTHKYGPFPGYVWAMLGAGVIVLVASRKSSAASSSSPAFLTTPPQSAIAGDGLGAGGGGGSDGSTVDPAVSYGLPSIVSPGAASSGPVIDTGPSMTQPVSAEGLTPSQAIDAGYTAGDYFAANPLPAGTSTAQALDALGAFPTATYDFGPSPTVDYSSIPTTPQGWAALTGASSPQNAAEPIAAAVATPTPTTPPQDTSMIGVHYLHGRDPEQ